MMPIKSLDSKMLKNNEQNLNSSDDLLALIFWLMKTRNTRLYLELNISAFLACYFNLSYARCF